MEIVIGRFRMVPSMASKGWDLHMSKESKIIKNINGKRKLTDETKLTDKVIGWDMSLTRCMEYIIHRELATTEEKIEAQKFLHAYRKKSEEVLEQFKKVENGIRQK